MPCKLYFWYHSLLFFIICRNGWTILWKCLGMIKWIICLSFRPFDTWNMTLPPLWLSNPVVLCFPWAEKGKGSDMVKNDVLPGGLLIVILIKVFSVLVYDRRFAKRVIWMTKENKLEKKSWKAHVAKQDKETLKHLACHRGMQSWKKFKLKGRFSYQGRLLYFSCLICLN